MLTSIALTLLACHPQPISLDNISLERARTLDGKRVLVSLLVTKQPYIWNGATIAGADDRPDGVARVAVLPGTRPDVEGKRIVVAGTLRVVEHPARWIGQELVLPWVEIRVEEAK